MMSLARRPLFHVLSAERRRRRCAGLIGGWLLAFSGAGAGPASAQDVFSADMVGEFPAMPAPVTELDPAFVVMVFEHACVLAAGQAAASTAWGADNGFLPVEPVHAANLLDGQPGRVMAGPASQGRLMLVVSDRQCTVWAEQTAGPPLRVALTSLIEDLLARGDALQVTTDRSAERAGAWRNQLQWRYRSDSQTQEWNLGAVTTLGPMKGTQVLRFTPAATSGSRAASGDSNFAPDGGPSVVR